MMRRATYVVLALLWAASAFAQGTVMPTPRQQFLDNAGLPCSGCGLFTYQAGTTTPQTSYSDSALTVPNTNPIILDSSGRATIYLSQTSYKFALASALGVVLWTVDNVTAVPTSTSTTAGFVESETYRFGGTSVLATVNTAFPVGATADKLAPNTSIWSIDSVNLTGTYALEAMLATDNGANTVSLELVNLSDASETALASITSISTTGARVRSGLITFASSGTAKNYGVKIKTTAGYGYAWSIRVVRTS